MGQTVAVRLPYNAAAACRSRFTRKVKRAAVGDASTSCCCDYRPGLVELRAPDLAPQRERPLELDSDLRPRLRAPVRVQHHAQDAVDAEPRMPEGGHRSHRFTLEPGPPSVAFLRKRVATRAGTPRTPSQGLAVQSRQSPCGTITLRGGHDEKKPVHDSVFGPYPCGRSVRLRRSRTGRAC